MLTNKTKKKRKDFKSCNIQKKKSSNERLISRFTSMLDKVIYEDYYELIVRLFVD